MEIAWGGGSVSVGSWKKGRRGDVGVMVTEDGKLGVGRGCKMGQG